MDSYAAFLRKVLMPAYETFKGKRLLHHLQEYQSHLHWSPEAIADYQWQQLQQLLQHAFQTSPYYRRLWQAQGIEDVRDIATLQDFRRLPPLTKDLVKAHYDELVSEVAADNIRKSTGGSTGQPFHFELDRESHTRREAVMWRGYGWLGAGLGVKTLYLWGADVGAVSRKKAMKMALYHRFYNRRMLNSFAMNRDNMGTYLESINRYRPKALVAYVNPLYQLARHINEHRLQAWSPRTILTGAEPLHDFQRQEIEQAFGCRVHDTYGCREFMLIAAECRHSGNLHINADHLLVETLDEQGRSQVGESGDLAITDLSNYGMPLIRYLNGDRATLLERRCDCANPLPLMQSVDGRKLDMIHTPSGATIPGELFPHLFKEFRAISKFQVRQQRLDQLEIRLVVSDGYSADDQQRIIEEINKYSQGELGLQFLQVEDIPLTASGKHRVTVCEL